MNERKLGYLGESFAADLLEMDGYKILERNYKSQWGEIDLIAEKDDELYFVEVKTRRNRLFGDPCEAVTKSKLQKMRKTAVDFLSKTETYYEFFSFQVMEIGVNQIRHIF